MKKIFEKRGKEILDHDLIEKISKENDISRGISSILLSRLESEEEIKDYINPNFEQLHDPFLFNDMKKATNRIKEAFDKNENIVIWSDFDCDGVCSASILMLELSQSTENISYHIPLRKEGYGVNKEGIRRLKEERDVDLIITADCGITSHEEVEYAKELGIDMIITDHHRADKGKPNAYAVLNPKVEDENYPFDGLCGAGVAYKLTEAIYGDSLLRVIDILALATVADLVPLEGENRVFVKQGLRAINYHKRPAFYEMSKYALKSLDEEVKAHHFGFRYGPMINASGRIGDAKDAVEMFITTDPKKRAILAKKLYEYNNTRKAREEIIIKEVEEKLKKVNMDEKRSIVVYGEGWEAGIVGIVASRFLEEHYKPTIILTHLPEEGVYKGSGRSISGIDLYNALHANEKYLGRWGGHAEAAGLEVKEEYIDEFIEAFESYIKENYSDDTFIPRVKYDVELELEEVDFKLIEDIELLEPFGIGNPSVYFKSKADIDNIKYMGKEEKHFSGEYSNEKATIRGVSFFKEPPTNGDHLEFIYKPNINEFMGNTELQLIVNEYKVIEKTSGPTDTKKSEEKKNDKDKEKSLDDALSSTKNFFKKDDIKEKIKEKTEEETNKEENIEKKEKKDEKNKEDTSKDKEIKEEIKEEMKENNIEIINEEEKEEKEEEYGGVKFSSPLNSVKVEDFIDNKTKVNQFKRAEIHNNIDLLNYTPKRFYDLTKIHTIESVRRENLVDEVVNIVVFIDSLKLSGNHLFASGRDLNGEGINIAWFNQAYLHPLIQTQREYSLYGKVDPYNMYKPQIVPIAYNSDIEKSKVFYPEYKKIKGMSDDYLKESINKAFELTKNNDFLEKALVDKYSLKPELKSLYDLHFPNSLEVIKESAKRQLFQKLFKFNLKLTQVNMGSGKNNTIKIEKTDLVEKLIKDLPFELTKDQDKAVRDSIKYMNKDTALQGLVQGDVGSGKTIVSILLMLAVANNGYQSALIAPTEVLAKQHYEEIVELLSDYGIKAGYLVGGLKVKERRKVLKGIKDGSIDMVIGTHAIIQDSVEFKNLGLVVIDEQHRFGVAQREKLRKREITPHILLMSATPIPRTLSMALYGDNMHVFNIKTMPSGRLPIKTEILMNDNQVYDFVYSEIQKGRQAYVVCPLIEESDSDMMKDVKSLEVEYENIVKYFSFDPSVKIEMISGKMKQKDINEKVNAFENGEVDILLSTTIIEVGVNVPNASVMVIKSSDRFGLAQLHQLRGRVGRGKYQSYCVLQPTKEDVKAEIIKSTTDGFKIAEHDLELRGHGNLVGTEQTGTFEEVSMMISNPELYKTIAKEVDVIFEDEERLDIYSWILDELKDLD